MPDQEKMKVALLDPDRDYNHRFNDVVRFLEAAGWRLRVKGSHRIFNHNGCPLLINLQPEKNGKAKAYQVRQVRQLIQRYEAHFK